MKTLDISYDKHVLENGLEVILFQRETIPLVTLNLWYRVGAANEVKGKTGLAHLFEHMMFQGSKNIKKEEHFRHVQEAGGVLNATTNLDRTNYFDTVPANFDEMLLWLESDRMGLFLESLTKEKLENQRGVVMNERLERYDNQPYGLAFEILIKNIYPENHPYYSPVIGWMDDIKSFTLDDVKDFFKTFYAPNNATLVLGGDFKKDKMLDNVKRYFGDFEPYNNIPKVTVPEFKIEETIKLEIEDDVQLSRIYIGWKGDKVFSEKDPAWDMLSDLLSGSKNARLQKRLIYENQKALDITAYNYSAKYDGKFFMIATANLGVELDEIKSIIFEEVNRLIEDGISDDEMERSKNSIKSSFIFSLQNQRFLVDHLNYYNFYLGEPNSFNYDLNRYKNVTKDDIINVAKELLSSNYVELRTIPNNKNTK